MELCRRNCEKKKRVFINFLNSRFYPFLLVSGGPGPARKLGEACRHIFSEYGLDWSRGVQEMTKNVFC